MNVFYLLCCLALFIIQNPVLFFGSVLVAILGGFWMLSQQNKPQSNPAQGETKP